MKNKNFFKKKLIIPNKYKKPCVICRIEVEQNEGYAVLNKGAGAWDTYHINCYNARYSNEPLPTK